MAYGYRAYAPTPLGTLYEHQLALNRHEVQWLNKFDLPQHGFMQVEVARAATVRLFVAVLNQLEARCKAAGSTVPKQVRALVDATEHYDYVYLRDTHQHINRGMAGHKVGAAIFLTIFQHCENVVRRHFDFRELDADRYFSEHNDPDREFNRCFGDALPALLAPLAAGLPPPSAATEQALNLADPKRWQLRFEQLRALLPASPARFEAAVHALSAQNCRTPNQATIYQQAAWQLGAAGGAATLRLYLHHLLHAAQRYPVKIKPLLKRMQQALLPLPEHQARFEALTLGLLHTRDLPAALAALPTVFHKERRKIELDGSAIRAARQQHAGTVELLNEYLRDDAPAPSAPAATPAAPETLAAAANTSAETVEITLAAPAAATAAVGTFAPGLALGATQQALLRLFAEQRLTLAQAAVEAFAAAHGALRNQLIDGLNEACYALLDDVLVEESGDNYTIYEGYFQRLTSSCQTT